MRKQKKILKSIANRDNIVARELLPLQVVLYPGHYGTYFGFKSNINDKEILVCSCCKESFNNFLEISFKNWANQSKWHQENNVAFYRGVIPLQLLEKIKNLKTKTINEILKQITFENKICHECNLSTPSFRYCHEMYGGVFKQNYGWYINKMANEYGMPKNHINPENTLFKLIPEEIKELFVLKPNYHYSPSEFLEMIRSHLILIHNNSDLLKKIPLNKGDKKKSLKKISRLKRKYKQLDSILTLHSKGHDFMNEFLYPFDKGILLAKREIEKQFEKQQRAISNIIENETRLRFGHKKIGEAWTSETILYYIVEKLYPDLTVKRHFRPKCLQGLELDVFIEELNVGIEYQGIQHFQPIKHWGGEESLEKLKKRDKLKQQLCKKNNIHLIYFNYYEELSEDFVKTRIEFM